MMQLSMLWQQGLSMRRKTTNQIPALRVRILTYRTVYSCFSTRSCLSHYKKSSQFNLLSLPATQ